MSDNKDINDINKDVVQQQDKKLYPKSFRITNEVHEAFKRISKDLGSNQDETLKQLCQCYEMNGNASTLPANIQADAQKFNNYIGAIQRLYINSLEYTNIVKDTESERYKEELNLKDNEIAEYQKIINSLKDDKESLNSQLKDLNQMYNQSKQDMKQLQDELRNTTSDLQERLKDKEQIIASLDKTFKDLENENANLKIKVDSYNDLHLKYRELQEKYNILSKDFDKYKIKSDKKLLEIEKEYNKKYDDMNNKHIKEIEFYSNKYDKLLMKIEKITLSKDNEN